MELITVVIPVYNVLPYLEQCVESVLRQTYPELEVLLVDDGSTDGSGQLCDQCAGKDARVRVIHQRNQGLGAARNTGIRQANGELLLFVDSDDWIYPTMVEELYQILTVYQAQMAICDAEVVTEDNRVIQRMESDLPPGEPICLQSLPQLMLAPHVAWNKLYRKELFFQNGCFYPAREWYEDFRVTTKLYTNARRVVYLNRPLYCYRKRCGSIQNNRDITRRKEKIDAMKDIICFYKERGLYQTYKDELEFLALWNVYYVPCVDLIRMDWNHPLIQQFSQFLRDAFPCYRHNPYLKTLNRRESLIFHLLNQNCRRGIAVIFYLHDWLKRWIGSKDGKFT